MRSRHPNFKTGKSITPDGYVIVFVGVAHHLADVRGYAYEHRLVAEKKIGRRLVEGEIVHHRDRNRSNNRPSNLKVYRSNGLHLHEHGSGNSKSPDEENVTIKCACGCGVTLLKYDNNNRPRKFIHGHNLH